MAYFGDPRIGFTDLDKSNPPDQTIDGRPYKYHPKRQPITARYGLGDGFYAIATAATPANFDLEKTLRELTNKVQRGNQTSASKKVADVAKSDS